MSTKSSFEALDQAFFDPWHIVSAHWIPSHDHADEGGTAVSSGDYAQLIGWFGGDPMTEDQPHFFNLRIPEGWQDEPVKRLYCFRGGTGTTYLPHIWGGHTLLSERKATCQIVLESEVSEWLNPVKSMPEWEPVHRTNQGATLVKALLREGFGSKPDFTYGGGSSYGASRFSKVAEAPDNAFDGIVIIHSYMEYIDTHIRRGLTPYVLKHGTAPADDPSLQLPSYAPGVLSWIYFVMSLALRELDPEYLASGKPFADYDIRTRPAKVEQTIEKKLALTGNLRTKVIHLSGLKEDAAPARFLKEDMLKVIARGKQDLIRYYGAPSYGHFQSDTGWADTPTVLNLWHLITAWVEDDAEPGWLATNFDGNVRHSKEAGHETDPLQYQLEAAAGRHSHLKVAKVLRRIS